VAEASRHFWSARPASPQPQDVAGERSEPGQLEARLAGVLVAALKEAFDRDRARFDLERRFQEAERERVERLARLERLRQTGDRMLAQVRLTAEMALAVWIASAVLVVWLPFGATLVPKILLSLGWLSLIATAGASFVVHKNLTAWLGAASEPHGDGAPAPPASLAWSALTWLFVAGLTLSAGGLISGL